MKPTDFAEHLSRYLGIHLPGQVGASANTVISYRDTFSLLLRYCNDIENLSPERLALKDVDHGLVQRFLLWIEEERGCCAATRNTRLAAIHAFFRYLQIEAPQMLHRCQEILSVCYKKTDQKPIAYMTLDGVRELLAQPDSSTATGRRDLTMLSLLYDTGARAQELADLKVEDVRLSSPTVVRLTGKGRKTRLVPIMGATERLLRQYLAEHDVGDPSDSRLPLFCNRAGNRLTRAGIAYILNKYLSQGKFAETNALPEQISPHGIRHSKAMHLLQSGVNIVYIRDLLGHTDVSTTQVYARADERIKREALEKAYPSPTPAVDESMEWNKDGTLMNWLKSLGK